MSVERKEFSERSLSLVQNGDLRAIQDNPDFHHYVTLYWSAKHRKKDILQYLLSRGVSQSCPYTEERRGVIINGRIATINVAYPLAIDAAIESKDIDSINLLLDHGAICTRHTTKTAIKTGDINILQLLVDRKQYVKDSRHSFHLFYRCLVNREFKCARLLVEQEISFVPFSQRVMTKYVDILRSLLDDGWWRSFLFSMSQKSKYMNLDIKKLIIDKKLNLDITKRYSECLYYKSFISKDILLFCIQPYF